MPLRHSDEDRAVPNGQCRSQSAPIRLVDEVTDRKRMILRGTEDKRFFLLIDLIHEQLDPVGLAFFDLNDLVEVGFFEVIADFDFALNQLVIGGTHGECASVNNTPTRRLQPDRP
jgi:hypothetical protein